RRLGRRHRAIDIAFAAEADRRHLFLGCRVDDVEGAGLDRRNPFAVDVELGEVAHGGCPPCVPRFRRDGSLSALSGAERAGVRWGASAPHPALSTSPEALQAY